MARAAVESAKSPLLLALIAGVCVGSVLAGLWSGDHVELGILPLGAFGVALNSLLLFTVPQAAVRARRRRDRRLRLGLHCCCFSWVRARACSACRWKRTCSIAARASRAAASWRRRTSSRSAASAWPRSCSRPCGCRVTTAADSRPKLLLAAADLPARGLFTIPVFFYIVFLIPQASIRFFVWLLSLTIYRVRVFGRENLPREGGALLVPNHVTWVDGILLMLTSSRPIRMVAWAAEHRSAARGSSGWPTCSARFRSTRQAEDDRRGPPRRPRGRSHNGELVCIFPEGGLTRTRPGAGLQAGHDENPGRHRAPRSFRSIWKGCGAASSASKGTSSSGNGPSDCPILCRSTSARRSPSPTTCHQVRQAVLRARRRRHATKHANR